MKLVINIPCYNEEKTIAQVISRIPKKIPRITKIEVQIVDDGSSDKTSELARKAGARVIRNKRNAGLGITFRRGLHAALKNGADIIVNMDGDGQFRSEDIPKLIEPIFSQDADMVTCTRFKNHNLTKNIPLLKKIGNKVFTSLISKLTSKKFTDTQCGFRAYTRRAAMKMTLFGEFTYTQEVFLDLVEKGCKIVEVPLPVIYHKDRKSRMVKSVMKYSLRSLGIIIRATRDINPLSFFGLPALIIFIIGFLGGTFSFGFWLVTHQTTPVRTLVFASFFLMTAGIILGILALMADMLLRMRRTQEEIMYRIKKREYEK